MLASGDALKRNASSGTRADTKARFLELPSWLTDEEKVTTRTPESLVARSTDIVTNRLRKIRPFSATELSVYKADPCSLARPSLKNPIVKHFWKLGGHSSYKRSLGHRLVITARVTKHMLDHTNCKFGAVLTSEKELVQLLTGSSSYQNRFERVQLVDRKVLQYCLRETSVAVEQVDTLAEVAIPGPGGITKPRLVVALDNIRYPLNVGNIIRTAVALNVDGLFYLPGTADPFDWKVSQITGGLQYMLPYIRGNPKALKSFCKAQELTPVVAHLEGDELESLDIAGGVCVILSNESEGPDSAILKFAKRVTLPMHPLVNSLNVSIAGAILIHQLQERIFAL